MIRNVVYRYSEVTKKWEPVNDIYTDAAEADEVGRDINMHEHRGVMILGLTDPIPFEVNDGMLARPHKFVLSYPPPTFGRS